MHFKLINCGSDMAKFDDLNQRALDYIITQGETGEVWTTPIIHPDTGDIGFRVKERIEAILTPEEAAEVFDAPDDWIDTEI